MTILPDTSAVIDGRVSERVESGEAERVLVPKAVVAELEAQANDHQDTGWSGLTELETLTELAEAGTIDLEYVGRRPAEGEREQAAEGGIDALIRDLAADHDATLLTSDLVQSEVARATGLAVEYVEPEVRTVEELDIERFFDDETMSVHLKTGVVAMAKRGSIGGMRFEPVGDEPLAEDQLAEWVEEIELAARTSSEGFTELDRHGMTIVQYRDYRIAVARPPFADGIEITAVRPIAATVLDDYQYADDLRERLLDHQRGVLVAGAPGAGKSTLAGAVANFLAESDFSVKTMEKPRDLQVGPDVTQYTELDGNMENTADALLMVRPDYTIYDEVRKTSDFSVFADMRLAGVGMVGVVHATRAIDAVGRLVGRVELGMIPQVVDTVVYVEAGEIDTIYDIKTEVKVPEGLVEEDLARPVIRIMDAENGEPAYEIYSFNRQVVTVPVGEESDDSGVDRIAKQEIEREIRSVARGNCEVELRSANTAVVYVEESDIATVIGKGGGRITDIENRLGIDIDVRTFDERPSGRTADSGGSGGNGSGGGSGGGGSGAGGNGTGEIVSPEITGRHVVIPMEGHAGNTVEVQADGEYLFTATVSRGGEVQVSRGSAIAEELEAAIDRNKQVTVAPS